MEGVIFIGRHVIGRKRKDCLEKECGSAVFESIFSTRFFARCTNKRESAKKGRKKARVQMRRVCAFRSTLLHGARRESAGRPEHSVRDMSPSYRRFPSISRKSLLNPVLVSRFDVGSKFLYSRKSAPNPLPLCLGGTDKNPKSQMRNLDSPQSPKMQKTPRKMKKYSAFSRILQRRVSNRPLRDRQIRHILIETITYFAFNALEPASNETLSTYR